MEAELKVRDREDARAKGPSLLWITDKTVGLRAGASDQDAGLDATDHAEVAYE